MDYCSKCLTPSTRPRVILSSEGICNACDYADKRSANLIDYESRSDEFFILLDQIKSTSLRSGSSYDCIVPWSGGKDSSSIAIRLRDDYGLNPLLVTFNPLIPTSVGVHNRRALLSYGFDSIYLDCDDRVSSALSLRFLRERANPKLHWNSGINSSLYSLAIKLGIKYIFYAEHGETHYGGRVLDKSSEQLRSYEEIIENLVGDDPENWVNDRISRRNLAPYIMPDPDLLDEASIEAHYFGYYFPWDVVSNYNLVRSKIDFRCHPSGRTPGTFTNFDSLDDYIDDVYYYMQYIKYGFGRAIRDASRQVQLGHLTRSEAIDICQKFDGEYPEDSIVRTCDFLGISIADFTAIVDSHRPSLIWERIGSSWRHRHDYKIYN